MCAELLPERIILDEWGYPVIDPTPLHGEELEHARRAERACPTLALLLERERERGRAERAAAERAPRSAVGRSRTAREQVRGGQAGPLAVRGEEVAHLLLGARGRAGRRR